MPILGTMSSFAGPVGFSAAVPMTYALTFYNVTQPGASTANEGDTVRYTLTTTGVANNTQIPYTSSGSISSGDLSSGSLTGNFTVVTTGTYPSGTANITFVFTNDLATEGTETLTVNAAGVSNTLSVIDTSTSPPVWFANNGTAGLHMRVLTETSGNTWIIGTPAGRSDLTVNGINIIQQRFANGAINQTYTYKANTYVGICSGALESTITTTANVNALYVGGAHSTAYSNYNNRSFIYKIDNRTGSLSWRKTITSANTTGGSGWNTNSMAADHTGVAILDAGVPANILKLTTAGATSFQYKLPTGLGYGRAVECREGYTYVSVDNFVGSNGYAQIYKFDSAGTVTWQRQIGIGNGLFIVAEALDLDNQSNVYLGARGNYGNNGYSHIIKLNSSGLTSWHYYIPYVDVIQHIKFNPVEACVYAVTGGTSSGLYVVKISDNGVVQWERTISLGSTTYSWASISFDPTGTYYYIHKANGTLAKLLTNGTGVGQYTGFTYAAASRGGSFVGGISTNVAGSVTPTAGAHTVTNETVLTLSANTYTQTLTTF